ncbi:cupin domain-containing protein [Dyella japonica]|uniref:Cupin n=1 Tax=Dyella japonica A8 TaxID=1217721 RepID=A0A075JVT6_9GAMM|nr:cupin domain-containing protein [Dyella japonica]AIF46034.1 cupin [Dyella japonica A8]
MPGPIVVDAGASRALNIVGEKLTVLASGDQTGSYEVFHQLGAEGSGPPPHHHPWDEAFYVIRGAVTFGMGDQELVALPGTFVHIPGGTTHWFRFGEDGTEMVSLTSHAGAAAMFAEFDREIAPDKPDIAKLVEIAGRHGATIGAPKG